MKQAVAADPHHVSRLRAGVDGRLEVRPHRTIVQTYPAPGDPCLRLVTGSPASAASAGSRGDNIGQPSRGGQRVRRRHRQRQLSGLAREQAPAVRHALHCASPDRAVLGAGNTVRLIVYEGHLDRQVVRNYYGCSRDRFQVDQLHAVGERLAESDFTGQTGFKDSQHAVLVGANVGGQSHGARLSLKVSFGIEIGVTGVNARRARR